MLMYKSNFTFTDCFLCKIKVLNHGLRIKNFIEPKPVNLTFHKLLLS